MSTQPLDHATLKRDIFANANKMLTHAQVGKILPDYGEEKSYVSAWVRHYKKNLPPPPFDPSMEARRVHMWLNWSLKTPRGNEMKLISFKLLRNVLAIS